MERKQPKCVEIGPGPCLACADAQATIAALTEALECALLEKPLPNGEYAHHAACNGDRRKPAGTLGLSCSCRVGRATIEALQAEVKDLKEWLSAYKQSMDLAQSELTQRTAEFQRHDGELQQICGQALGYPWFKDDQKNFPGATEKDGVCVGEHVGITIAQELANAYRKRTAELEAAKASQAIDLKNNNEYREQVATLQAKLERVRGERDEQAGYAQSYCDKADLWGELVDQAQKERDELRTLIAALPKVEGVVDIKRGEGLWYIWMILPNGSYVMCGRFRSQLEAEAYAAILTHRQGMEGV